MCIRSRTMQTASDVIQEMAYKQVRAEVYDEIISALEKEISYLYKGDINCGIGVAIDKVKLMKEQNNE